MSKVRELLSIVALVLVANLITPVGTDAALIADAIADWDANIDISTGLPPQHHPDTAGVGTWSYQRQDNFGTLNRVELNQDLGFPRYDPQSGGGSGTWEAPYIQREFMHAGNPPPAGGSHAARIWSFVGTGTFRIVGSFQHIDQRPNQGDGVEFRILRNQGPADETLFQLPVLDGGGGSFDVLVSLGGVNHISFLLGSRTDFLDEAISMTAQIHSASTVPLPASLPLFGTGLALLGVFGWRRFRAPPGHA